MPSKLVEDALKRATPPKQEENNQVLDRARQTIDGKTMKTVDEPATPKPKVGQPDPNGAARAKLSPDFRDKIESIQKGGQDYYPAPEVQEHAPPELTTPEPLPNITSLDFLENSGPMIEEIEIIP